MYHPLGRDYIIVCFDKIVNISSTILDSFASTSVQSDDWHPRRHLAAETKSDSKSRTPVPA